MKRFSKNTQHGMTMLELSVVLLVLIASAGLVVPYVGGTGHAAMCQATDATMQAVKEAIMGGAAGNGYYADMLGEYPKATKGADTADYNLTFLFTKPAVWGAYNPQTGVGWRGSYLTSGGHIDAAYVDGDVNNGELDASFARVGTDVFDPDTNSGGKVHALIKNTVDAQVFDAWRRPIVLQAPYYDDDGAGPHAAAYHPEYARLVSAGPGNGLEIGAAIIDTPITEKDAASRGDDRVLYLANPDPKAGGNTPCDQT